MTRALAAVLAALGTAAGAAAQNAPAPQLPVGIVGTTPRSVSKGVLDLLSYSVVPDGTASALQLDRSGGSDDIGITLGQLGAGFTFSDTFPLYLEGYLGYGRYDPRFVFSDGEEERQLPTRWDQVALTVGIGWDLRLAKSLYLRPILNAAVARVTSDTALAGRLIEFRTDRDLAFLDRAARTPGGSEGRWCWPTTTTCPRGRSTLSCGARSCTCRPSVTPRPRCGAIPRR